MARKKAAAPRIRDRVTELRRVPGHELRANPKNFRTHPAGQRSALAGILEQIGIAGALLGRDTPDGVELIDGHLRAEDYGDVEWPVLILDVDAPEADLLLATYDPIAALAGCDADLLASLVDGMQTEARGLAELARGVAPTGDSLETPPAPQAYVAQHGVIVICRDAAHQELVFAELSDAGHECRVVVT